MSETSFPEPCIDPWGESVRSWPNRGQRHQEERTEEGSEKEQARKGGAGGGEGPDVKGGSRGKGEAGQLSVPPMSTIGEA